LKDEWNGWDRAVGAATDNNETIDHRQSILDKMVDILNRRNYIRNLVRDVNEAME